MIYAILFILLAASGGPPAAPYRCDPALAALFTPRAPAAGRYDVCTTTAAIEDAVRADITGRGVHVGTLESVDPLDAFGAAGSYDRPALARLFGGRRARVARGWSQDGLILTSVTYVTPFPDRAFTALVPGTLVIRHVLENGGL